MFLARTARQWHDTHHFKVMAKELPPHLRHQLEELKHLRKRYGKALLMLMVVASVLFGGRAVSAQTAIEIAPPFITTISRDISDEEIFYAGGKVDVGGADVIIYLQNLRTGETESHSVIADNRGDWFYQHSGFLGGGDYLLWAQARFAGASSPPGPQVQLTVRQTALRFGASRLSYEALYLVLLLLVLSATAGLVGYIVYHGLHAREKRQLMEKEIREAEESVRRGFAVLRRDIESELAVIKKAKLKGDLRDEERTREAQLLRDLAWAEKYVSKEVWDIDSVS